MVSSSASSLSRRRFLRRAAQGTAGSLALFGIPWTEVEARAGQFGIVPGTRVDARGQALPLGGGTDAFIGELFFAAFGFAPKGSALCNGQLLSVTANSALFSLLGTRFGGDGESTFALPDFRGRIPMHQGQGDGLTPRDLGEQGGVASITMLTAEMPVHSHGGPQIGSGRRVRTPSATAFPASSLEQKVYGVTARSAMDPVTPVGNGDPISNMPPYLVLNICISLQGTFPPRP